ncbi:hypothetical protein OG410_33320 [Streptomyces sp. NBC_00659]|uniref:hypothetical protein n=1 Tax=Streptomyces sp. NBC_00659 TaxID=2903669 RepID=UPI002E3007A2|nr:hypothetical protein [Streptomyces sp. NBC_00659]
MRRTARVLYATALAGAALGAAASGAAADPAAEVSPGSVEPGGTVTVTVSCDAIGGTLPDSIDASSQGFQEGKVQLHRVEGAGPGAAGAASYSGTAHIGSGEPDPAAGSATEESGRGFDEVSPGTNGSGAAANSDAKNSADVPAGARAGAVSSAPEGWATVVPDAQVPAPGAGDPVVPDLLIPDTDSPDTVGPDSVAPETVGPDSVAPDDLGPDTVGPDTVPEPLSPDAVGSGTAAPGTVEPDIAGPDIAGPDTGGADGRWNVGGVCPAPPGGHGKQWTASYAVARGATATHGPDSGTGSDTGVGERPPTIQRGVHAGEGGVFTDSVPALVAGGLLIAGALGAAAQRVHRLRRRRR